jgi:hypothetical protein
MFPSQVYISLFKLVFVHDMGSKQVDIAPIAYLTESVGEEVRRASALPANHLPFPTGKKYGFISFSGHNSFLGLLG